MQTRHNIWISVTSSLFTSDREHDQHISCCNCFLFRKSSPQYFCDTLKSVISILAYNSCTKMSSLVRFVKKLQKMSELWHFLKKLSECLMEYHESYQNCHSELGRHFRISKLDCSKANYFRAKTPHGVHYGVCTCGLESTERVGEVQGTRARRDGPYHISFPADSRSSLMLDQHAQGRGLIAVEADPDRASARKRASARSGSAMRISIWNLYMESCRKSRCKFKRNERCRVPATWLKFHPLGSNTCRYTRSLITPPCKTYSKRKA